MGSGASPLAMTTRSSKNTAAGVPLNATTARGGVPDAERGTDRRPRAAPVRLAARTPRRHGDGASGPGAESRRPADARRLFRTVFRALLLESLLAMFGVSRT